MTLSKLRWLATSALLCVASALAAESLLDRLLRIAGLTANPPAHIMAPGDDIEAGDLWIAEPGMPAVALTKDGGYRSPVFSPADGSLLALKGGKVVRLRGAGRETVVVAARGVRKLVGMAANKPDELVVLSDGTAPLAILSLKTGRLAPLPFDANSEAQRDMLAQIRGQERDYGATRLSVKTESKRIRQRTIEWTDVYLRRAGAAPQNVSACDGVNCGEPALSPDAKTVVFVKSGG